MEIFKTKKCYVCGRKFRYWELEFIQNKQNILNLDSKLIITLIEKGIVCYNCRRYR